MKELIIALAVLFIAGLIAFVRGCCKVAGNADEAVNENQQLWQEIEDSNNPPEPITSDFVEDNRYG